MRVIRNDAFIQKRMRWTQRGLLAGMVLLVLSFLMSMRASLLSYLPLIAGFLSAMTAARMGNRYVMPPRPDQALDKLLKGLDAKHVLFHYLLPAEHLLLTPSGLIAIRMCRQRGRISVRKGRWRHGPFSQRLRVLIGEVGLGNPARDLRWQLGEMARLLGSLELGEDELPLEGLIVFYSDRTQLVADDPEFPVVTADDVKATVRALAEAHPALAGRTHKALVAAFRGEE